MARVSPHAVGLVSVLVAAGASVLLLAERRGPRSIEAGFWFEHVSYASPRLGGALTAEDLLIISSTAHAEIVRAFEGLSISVTNRRDARYQVRVVQQVRDHRFQRDVGVAGQSRGVPGLGGQGTVSFTFFANGALVYAPDNPPRPALVEAIGRGLGRAAVHEFTHQFLPKAVIHSRDERSYEYYSAARQAQFFGDMRWDLARPLLQARLGW
jgi:hypothetical protein